MKNLDTLDTFYIEHYRGNVVCPFPYWLQRELVSTSVQCPDSDTVIFRRFLKAASAAESFRLIHGIDRRQQRRAQQ